MPFFILSSDLLKQGFTQVEIDSADSKQSKSKMFVVGAIYGGDKDTFGGKWQAHKIGYMRFVNAKNNEKVEMTAEEVAALAEANGGELKVGTTYELSNNRTVLLDGKGVSWTCAYTLNDNPIDYLTMNLLLSSGRHDHAGNHIVPLGDVRDWMRIAKVTKVDRTAMTELADLLNKRGLCFTASDYDAKASNGKLFRCEFLHPYFADTFKAE